MSSWVLVENGDVIDGMGSAPLRRTSVLIKDNLIVGLGQDASREAVPRGEDVSVIDATEKTIMPGLIDAHCHLTYGESRTQEEQDLYTSVESRTLRAAWNVSKMLRAGVTSFSEPGGSYYIGVAIRDAIKAGKLTGPRITTSSRYLTTSNGIADFYPESVGVPDGSSGLLTNTVGEMVTAVRKHVKNGVDLIKLADSPYGDYQAFTYDEMAAVTEIAHQLNKKVTIHARGAAEVDAAVRAGVDWIMHGNLMTDEVIAKLAASKIPLCPTLLLHSNWATWGHLLGTPGGIRDGTKWMLERSAETLHKAHAAGVRFMMGTDTGFAPTPFGEWHARELELLMEYAGVSALEAIRAGTSNAARVVNLDGQLGVVAPGMLADLLVVDGDPSKDIRVLQDRSRIEKVVQDGRILDFEDEPEKPAWPHDRAQVLAVRELTHRLVSEGSEESTEGAQEPVTYNQYEARMMMAELRDHEVAARKADG